MTTGRAGLVLGGMLALASSGVTAAPRETWVVPAGQVNTGDEYVVGRRAQVAGVQDGDLAAAVQSLVVTGEIRGDLFAVARRIDLPGTLGDSVRAMGERATVEGTVDGDLLFAGGELIIGPDAHVTGDVLAASGEVQILGTVDGDLKLACGQVELGARIGRNASIQADTIEIDAATRIGGDLEYRARNELTLAPGIVAGRVQYERPKQDEAEDARFGAGDVLWWLWLAAGCLVVGLAVLAATRGRVRLTAEALSSETLLSLGLGFAAAIVTPVAIVLALLPLVTIPLSVLAALLYVVVLYVAKIPVALWLGGLLLRGLGRPLGRGVVALCIGVPLLYLLFEIPYLGGLVWLATVFLGLGSMAVALWRALRRETVAAAP